ncbi:Anaphase-promoting complex subunit 10 [Cucumispora dikerogammari]|nr:Anaphase-promoting complex subunit 10 [Cucumispora dikerogammari]
MNIRLSSEKPGHGIKELFSYNNLDTYWSSDDILPHFIQIEFDYLQYIKQIQLHISFHKDDSYTPEIIDFFFGPTMDSLTKVTPRPYIEPMGITKVSIDEYVQYLFVEIKRNHSDGKDSHIRGLKIVDEGDNVIDWAHCCDDEWL